MSNGRRNRKTDGHNIKRALQGEKRAKKGMQEENKKKFYIMIDSDTLLESSLSQTEKVIYGIILSHSLNDDGHCYLKYKTISQYANIQKRELYYCLRKLMKKNYIQKIEKNNKIYLKPLTPAFVYLKEKIAVAEFLNNTNTAQRERKQYDRGFEYDVFNEED